MGIQRGKNTFRNTALPMHRIRLGSFVKMLVCVSGAGGGGGGGSGINLVS